MIHLSLGNLLKNKIHDVNIGTFHSICAKILRKHASAVNLTSNFTIVDRDDQLRLIKNIPLELYYQTLMNFHKVSLTWPTYY